jgi:hypothetical protein
MSCNLISHGQTSAEMSHGLAKLADPDGHRHWVSHGHWRCLARDRSSGMTLLGVLEQCEAVKWTLAVFLSLAELRPLPRGLV